MIPNIRDPQTWMMDRIQAVRDLGRAGYAGAAETGRVRDGEIVWASGLGLDSGYFEPNALAPLALP